MTVAVTWWGHASATVELGGVRVALDPLLSDHLLHLRRYTATPLPAASDADVVLVSHLHHDHLHLPSLRRFGPDVPLVVPHGSKQLVRGLGLHRVVSVAPGDTVEVGGVTVEALPAAHDGRRSPWSRHRGVAIGFRVVEADRAFWFPGDTGLRDELLDIEAVDLRSARGA